MPSACAGVGFACAGFPLRKRRISSFANRGRVWGHGLRGGPAHARVQNPPSAGPGARNDPARRSGHDASGRVARVSARPRPCAGQHVVPSQSGGPRSLQPGARRAGGDGALVACWLPARRAAKVASMVALRFEWALSPLVHARGSVRARSPSKSSGRSLRRCTPSGSLTIHRYGAITLAACALVGLLESQMAVANRAVLLRFAVCPLFVAANINAALPEPPKQHEPCVQPTGAGAPDYVVKVAATLFDAGLADPRSGEYREVAPAFYDAGAGALRTHAGVFPGDYAVCWNGLVYHVQRIGGPADLEHDVRTSAGAEPWSDRMLIRKGLPAWLWLKLSLTYRYDNPAAPGGIFRRCEVISD